MFFLYKICPQTGQPSRENVASGKQKSRVSSPFHHFSRDKNTLIPEW